MMLKINTKDIIRLFDIEDPEMKGHISSIIGVVGEDLGAALFKHFCERELKESVAISGMYKPKSKTRPWSRLDRWVYVRNNSGKNIAYQTEIKNWSARALGGRNINIDDDVNEIALDYWRMILKRLNALKLNSENKVFREMQNPPDLPPSATELPLIIYWWPLSRNGKKLDIFFNTKIHRRVLYIFSISSYLRQLKNKELVLEMPEAQFRIGQLNKFFRR